MPDSADMRTAVIVEDDRDLRHLLVEIFESAGFSVVTAGNGIDGVRAALAYDPLITTLDVSMPGIDGFEAARRIRAANGRTHIIMLTAMSEESDVVLGLAAGADDYIVKPFRPREFRARIDAVLRRPRPAAGVPQAPAQESAGPSFPRTGTSTSNMPVISARQAQQAASAPPAAAPQPAAPQPAPTPPTAPEPQRPAPEPQRSAPEPQVDDVDDDDTIVIAEVEPASGAITLHDPTIGWLRHRDLRFDPDTGTTLIGERQVILTQTETALLHTLLESRRRIRSRADLTLVLRGESYVTSYFVGEADKKAVETQMSSLRRKLGDAAVPVARYIEAVRDVGYRLTPETDTLG